MNPNTPHAEAVESPDSLYDFYDPILLSPNPKSQELNKELTFLSQCLAQNLIRVFQSIMLILYITYSMVHGLNSLPSFYILAVIALLPYILFSLKGTRAPKRIHFFPQLKKKLHIHPERYHANCYAALFTTFLLLLWQIVQLRTLFAYRWLTFYPAIIAILSLLTSLFGPALIRLLLKIRLKQGRI